MALNETIATGRKFRELIDEAVMLWERISFWCKASDCEFDDGKTAEVKLGAINGITDSLTSDASNIVASAAAVKALNDKITEINSNLQKTLRVYVTKVPNWVGGDLYTYANVQVTDTQTGTVLCNFNTANTHHQYGADASQNITV